MDLEESTFLTSYYTTKLQSSGQYGTVTKTEIKKTIPFTMAMKRIKYLAINLLKETKDIYKTIKHW